VSDVLYVTLIVIGAGIVGAIAGVKVADVLHSYNRHKGTMLLLIVTIVVLVSILWVSVLNWLLQ